MRKSFEEVVVGSVLLLASLVVVGMGEVLLGRQLHWPGDAGAVP